jgi:hypothetical protein
MQTLKEEAITAIFNVLNLDVTFGITFRFTRKDIEDWFDSSPEIERTDEEYKRIAKNPYLTAGAFLFDKRRFG